MNQPTLTDGLGRPHTYLRISLTERCNLRCQYCMPAEGVNLKPRDHILTFEEIERLAGYFVSRGVTKIRLTGGEPLVRRHAEHLVARLGALQGLQALAMTTNGLVLSRKLAALREGGLTHINLSLDTLRADRFESITRRPGLDVVLKAMDDALEAGYEPLKVNCVVMKGVNDDELVDFVGLTADRPLDVRFIEYMPFDGNRWSDAQFMPFRAMRSRIEAETGPLEALGQGPNETSVAYRVPGHVGTLGFVASMSQPFCEGCNRLRVTADGQLKVCLFGKAEVSLRDALREGATDEDLDRIVSEALRRKAPAHAGMHVIARSENRPMILIGG